MPSGGRRPGAGRPRGSNWKPKVVDLRAMAKEHTSQVIGTSRDPLLVVIEAASDESLSMETRLGAAAIALPFLYPRLSAAAVQTTHTSVKVDAAALLDRLSERIGRLALSETPLLDAETVTGAADDAEVAA